MMWLRRWLLHGMSRHEVMLPAALALPSRRAEDQAREQTVRAEQEDLRARLEALRAAVRAQSVEDR